jgi:hypothetical protein
LPADATKEMGWSIEQATNEAAGKAVLDHQ